MNREIKFRAFDTKRKRMFPVYGIGNDFATEDTLDGVDPGYNAFHGEDFKQLEIMQFTGLKDKDGSYVYEGDIIRYFNFIESGTGVIKFNHGFGIEWDLKTIKTTNPTSFSPLFYFQFSPEIQIIGNIYENPELL